MVRLRKGAATGRWAGAALGALLTAVVLAGHLPPLRAQDGRQGHRFTYSSHAVEVTVEPDYVLHVQERVAYRFQGRGEKVGIYIPFKYGAVHRPQVLNEAGNPLPQGVQEVQRGDEGITLWYDASGVAGESAVVYDYFLYEALDRAGDRVGLRWSATPEVHAAPIEQSAVTIRLPERINPSDLDLWAYPVGYEGLVDTGLQGGSAATCRSRDIPPDAYYLFSCYWPASIMRPGAGTEAPQDSYSAGSWDYERFDAEITVHPDASLTVRETQVANFRGSFGSLDRDLTVAAVGGAGGRTCGRVRFRDIRVYDLAGDAYDAGRWSVEDIEGGRRVHIEFSARDQQLGWIIEYRVTGAVVYCDGYDRLVLDAVSGERGVPLRSSEIRVRLPAGTDMGRVRAEMPIAGAALPAAYGHGVEGGTAWWRASQVAPGTTYAADISFPKGTVAVPWQYRDSFLATVALLAAAFVLLAFLLVLTHWLRRRRDFGLTPEGTAGSSSPPGLPPAVVGLLLEGRPRPGDIAATIVDLARRGYLVISERVEDARLTRAAYGFRRRREAAGELEAFERELMEGLFESGEAAAVSDLEGGFRARLPFILGAVEGLAAEEELIYTDTGRVKFLYACLGLGISAASLAAWRLLAARLDIGHFQLFAPAFALCGLMLLAASLAMPRLTRKGSQACRHARDFREYLRGAEGRGAAPMGAEEFQEGLPYAMVLGVAAAWAARFEGVADAPPEWLEGAGEGGASRLAASLSGLARSVDEALASRPAVRGSGGGGFAGGFYGGGSGGASPAE